jgi:hypothetical protein
MMDKPMSGEQMRDAIRELQDTLVVMALIEKTQTEHLRDLVQFRIQSERFRLRTEENLAEITDKLNGLIGYGAGQKPGGPKT